MEPNKANRLNARLRELAPNTSGQLFEESKMPFNLAGELLDNSTTSEGEARARAMAESEAKKAQTTFTLENYKCGFDGWENDQIDCPKCLSESPFHEC